MKLSVYNPTGSRVAINGSGRFAGIVVRSCFAVRGHQLFDVASQDHANWLIKHLNAACPSAQASVIGDDAIQVESEQNGLSVDATATLGEIAAGAAVTEITAADGIEPEAEPETPAPAEVVADEPAKPAGKKNKTVTETKE